MFTFRVKSGSLVSLVTTDFKAMEPNRGHYSKEIFLATHSSQILPKGSPLMVGRPFWNNKRSYLQSSICFYHPFPSQPGFQNTILWLKDTGILKKLKDDAMNPPMPIQRPKVRHNQPLILRQLGITMIILVVGLLIAVLAFVGELWSNRRKTDAIDHFEMSARTTSEQGIWHSETFGVQSALQIQNRPEFWIALWIALRIGVKTPHSNPK